MLDLILESCSHYIIKCAHIQGIGCLIGNGVGPVNVAELLHQGEDMAYFSSDDATVEQLLMAIGLFIGGEIRNLISKVGTVRLHPGIIQGFFLISAENTHGVFGVKGIFKRIFYYFHIRNICEKYVFDLSVVFFQKISIHQVPKCICAEWTFKVHPYKLDKVRISGRKGFLSKMIVENEAFQTESLDGLTPFFDDSKIIIGQYLVAIDIVGAGK